MDDEIDFDTKFPMLAQKCDKFYLEKPIGSSANCHNFN